MTRKRKLRILILLLLGALVYLERDKLTRLLPEKLSYELYFPASLDMRKPHPLVLALSPAGVGKDLLPVWKPVCDRYGWILVASNNSRNGQLFGEGEDLLLAAIAQVSSQLPVDRARIYATGCSGGGQEAEYLTSAYPDVFRACIVNTGRIHPQFLDKSSEKFWVRGKCAIFIASPTDFRYEEMKKDKVFLEGFSWTTKWIEFEGGHTLAPASVYLEAAAWLEEQHGQPGRN
jgi:hypothetical protein